MILYLVGYIPRERLHEFGETKARAVRKAVADHETRLQDIAGRSDTLSRTRPLQVGVRQACIVI